MSDGDVVYEGRVELCLSGVWGTISYDGWSVQDSTVACRQLGYKFEGMINNCILWLLDFEWIFLFLMEQDNTRFISSDYSYYFYDGDYTQFGPGSGPIWLSDVLCTGSENRLLHCHYRNKTYRTTHKDDVGFSCKPC